jgi:thioredoxin reductase
MSRLAEKEIPVLNTRVTGIEEHGRELGTLYLEDGSRIDGVFRGYSTMGLEPKSALAASLGAELDENGYIKTDADHQTTVTGAYAIGDVAGRSIADRASGVSAWTPR